MKKLISESKKYQIDTLTGIITNIAVNKIIPLQWDGTFMILEDKKLQEFKVIFENGKYEVISKNVTQQLTDEDFKNKYKNIYFTSSTNLYTVVLHKNKVKYYIGQFKTRELAYDAKMKKLEELKNVTN